MARRNQNQSNQEDEVKNEKAQEKEITAFEPKKVTYISRYLELRLVVKASYKKELEGQIVVTPGRSIQFHDGVYETDDQDEIKFLEAHKNFGNIFIRVEKGDAKKQREDKYKDLDTREREMQAEIKRLREENKRLKDEQGNDDAEEKNKVEEGEEAAF
jgi:hypothetical protein